MSGAFVTSSIPVISNSAVSTRAAGPNQVRICSRNRSRPATTRPRNVASCNRSRIPNEAYVPFREPARKLRSRGSANPLKLINPCRCLECPAPPLEKRLDFKRILLGYISIRAGRDQTQDILQGRTRRIVRDQTNIGKWENAYRSTGKRREKPGQKRCSMEGRTTKNQGCQPHGPKHGPSGKDSIFDFVTRHP